MGSHLKFISFFTFLDWNNTQNRPNDDLLLFTNNICSSWFVMNQDRFNKCSGDASLGSWRSSRASRTGLSCRYAMSLFGAVMRWWSDPSPSVSSDIEDAIDSSDPSLSSTMEIKTQLVSSEIRKFFFFGQKEKTRYKLTREFEGFGLSNRWELYAFWKDTVTERT